MVVTFARSRTNKDNANVWTTWNLPVVRQDETTDKDRKCVENWIAADVNQDQKQKPRPTSVQSSVGTIFSVPNISVQKRAPMGLLQYPAIMNYEQDIELPCINLLFLLFRQKLELVQDSQICAHNLHPPHVFQIFPPSASFIACNLPSIYDLLFAKALKFALPVLAQDGGASKSSFCCFGFTQNPPKALKYSI